MGGALASASVSGWTTTTAAGMAALVVTAGLRTWRPVTTGEDALQRFLIAGEVALAVAVVHVTGYWLSPFIFSLIAAVGLAGFTVGFGFALTGAVASTVVVAVPYIVDSERDTSSILRLSARWGLELLLVAAIAGYVRHLSRLAEERQSEVLDQVSRLTEANELLTSLNDVAQDLPASLDLEDVLDATVARLRSFWELSAVAVLVPDETSERWIVVRQEGVRLPALLSTDDLPPVLQQVMASPRGVTIPVLTGVGRERGLSHTSGSGVYAPLHARDELVGLVAAEHPDQGRFGRAEMELLRGFTETAALAIDNARWFGRLRTIGADAERTRIARDLHDRVGQSLAVIGFELERLSRHSTDDELRPGLERLRGDLRQAMGEIRDTLYDLRTDVTEERGIVRTLEAFLHRVEQRSGASVQLLASGDGLRLPLPQEREMWLVAQEAITNAERHARPTEISVWWWCDGHRAELEVVDDGSGFDLGARRTRSSDGIVRMREQAASIGAALSIDSTPSKGTRVRCTLGPS